jgi:hypothetical protein
MRLASVRSDATLVRVFAIGDAALSKARGRPTM